MVLLRKPVMKILMRIVNKCIMNVLHELKLGSEPEQDMNA